MNRRRPAQDGFTLLEVMIALLVAMVGLIGTVAVQMAAMNANKNTNDAQIAMRLASKTIEEFNTRRTQANPFIDMLAPIANGSWSTAVYLDAQGRSSTGESPSNRWRMRTRVVDLGAGNPYAISVEVVYSLDSGTAKSVLLDIERRKSW
jgi:prepilin-type N-terminal cleavage/methylation domain-containing protein